ncbi:uncharacterized protein [Diabrotica undecimpunctata]|uniref:uncharacterized protein n=1 Tax=Diabrotica undecimpunctata TaxID=50387 RepID=UPI003B63F56F
MLSKQEMKDSYKTVPRCFQENETVFARSFAPGGQKWLPSKIIETTGPLSYKVQTPDGKILRRHSAQIKTRVCDQETTDEVIPSTSMETKLLITPQPLFLHPNEFVDTKPEIVEQAAEFIKPPARIRKPPRYLEDYDE